VINKAILIIKGEKPFDSHEPSLLVALLYILNFVIDKEAILDRQLSLQRELNDLEELIKQL
jgi:hypothetical protein